MIYNRGEVKRETDLIIVDAAELAAEIARKEEEDMRAAEDQMGEEFDYMDDQDMDTSLDDRAFDMGRDDEADRFNESQFPDEYYFDHFAVNEV